MVQLPPDDQLAFDADGYARRLAGPKGLDHFNRELREREPVHFAGVFSAAEAATLCSIDLLADLLLPDSVAAASIDIYSNDYLVRLTDMLHKSDRLAVDVIAEQLQQGATIRFRNLERHETPLRALAVAIGRLFQCTTDINAYLTPSQSHGFSPHFDNSDVMVVQLLGAKQWRLYPDYRNRVELPLRDTPWDADKYRPGREVQQTELHPGDVLYIPRGGMHSAACEDDLSLHLTISMDTDPMVDQLSLLMHTWAQQDVRARRRLPEESDEAHSALLQLAQDFHHWLQDNASSFSNSTNDPQNRDRQELREKFKQALGSINQSPQQN